MKNLYCVIGPSGSGKTTVVEALSRDHGLVSVESYTTRPPRYSGESGHIFVTDEAFDKLGELCAFVEYNGYRYGVTTDILEKSDLYVIDPEGARYLQEHYRGDKVIYNIWLEANPKKLYQRMLDRGDSVEAATARCEYDKKAFSAANKLKTMCYTPGLIIHTDLYSPNEVAKRVWQYIRSAEGI